MTNLIKSAKIILIISLGILFSDSLVFAIGEIATGPTTVYKVTLKKFELYNGSGWITLYDGTGAGNLDIAAVSAGASAGNFFSGLSVPDGTYTQARVTPYSIFTIKGSLSWGGNTYYTTATKNGSGWSTPSTTASNLAECTIDVDQSNITPVTTVFATPITVTNGVADHKVRVSFDVSASLGLGPGATSMWPMAPTVTVTVE